jgi:hypothetical protein
MKPQRQHKHDRLVTPGGSSAEIACDHAVAPFDRVCRDAERTWGIDRLPELVPPDMAARFGKAMGVLNAAINADDPDATTAAAANCIRGLQAMDAAARAAGHQPIAPEAWEFEIDGKPCALLRDDRAWPAYAAQRPGVRVYSLREVSLALAAYGQTVAAVKDALPGAAVSAVRPAPSALELELEDELPWK